MTERINFIVSPGLRAIEISIDEEARATAFEPVVIADGPAPLAVRTVADRRAIAQLLEEVVGDLPADDRGRVGEMLIDLLAHDPHLAMLLRQAFAS